jgi:hypothetical protein
MAHANNATATSTHVGQPAAPKIKRAAEDNASKSNNTRKTAAPVAMHVGLVKYAKTGPVDAKTASQEAATPVPMAHNK